MLGRKSILVKLVLIMLFLSVVSGGIILGIALNEQKGNMETTLIQENKRLAEVAARSIEAGYIEQSWPFRTLKQINDSEDVLFWWIVKPDGMIHLADNPGMRGKRIDIASFEAEEGADVKDYVYGGEDIKFLVQPLCIGEPGKTWYLCIGISLKSLKAAANRMIFTSLSYFFLIIAFACALSFLLARRFTKPIMQLIGGTKAISRGDFDTKVKIKTGDEIEGLGDAFNKMAVQVKSSVALERAARKETENIMNTMVETLIVVDSEGNIRNANEATFDLLGYSEEELIAKSLSKITGKKEAEEKFERLLKEGSIKDFETTYLTKDGREVPVNFSASSLKDGNGELKGFVCVAGDITERKGAQEALRKSEEKYRTLIESSFTGIFIHQDGKYVFVNNRFAKIHGYTPEELLGREHWLLVRSDERETVRQKALKRLNGEAVPQSYEIRRLKKDGKTIWCRMMATPIEYRDRPAIMGNIMDITEIKHAKEERKKLEAQLSQAQKMEAIGVLAGGVAHDFNNLLTVIIGNAQLALMDVIKDESLRKEIGEIKKAGDRAASLTRQLLAFSRKQVIQPEVLDLNELLTGIEKMLGRLIGEDVELLTIPEPALWQVEVDPGQMEQVIMNLAVNARDAMSTCADSAAGRPQGGKLTIETANVDLDENYFREHGIKKTPGPYVMLAISDTGKGMGKETQEHIFEPFFTTKEVGKGTGLGLSTVYGIVKQNNGFVWVYSEPGKGTTFKVYLPKAEGDADSEEKQRLPVMELDGSETVLIVEDDEGLQKLAQEVLQSYGYRILAAENGEEALMVGKEHEGPIHLLLTDVVMPKMGGREAAKRMQPLYPQMKVIYMSGYTDNAIVHHGVLSPGLNFLQKPFTPEGLARKVREVIDAGQK